MKSEKHAARRAQLELLKILGESGDDYLFIWDLETDYVFFSGNLSQRYPLLRDGAGYCSIRQWYGIVYEKDLPELEKQAEQVRQGARKTYNLEYRLVDREGNRVWVKCRGQCQTDENGRPAALIGRVSDTALEQKVDQLTGAFNALRLSEDMDRILKAKIPCSLLLVGVDNLKHINLRHGREYGDQILCKIADTLEELIGAGLRIYRVNGDCFAVNLPVPESDKAEDIYQQLCGQMAKYCTLSGGVVSYQEHQNADSSALYQYAEDALDKAKRMGKNNLAVFSQKDYEEKLSTVELQEELHQSIKNGFSGFSLCYQPQIHAKNYALFGVEVLLRYQSPTRGAVSPVEFVPVLEQTGMICSVGLWVLKTALSQCQVWRRSIPELHISVNMSYVQLSKDEISSEVLSCLEESGLPGKALTLEVTESMQLQDYSYFNRLFYQWRQAGIEISVDDFGTGYSSLGYLKNLEINEIKIDRCFVSGIQHSAYNYRLLSNMVELARSSQIRVCCEGVETQEELAVLEELEPDLLQGFLFHRPLTPAEFERAYIQQDTPEYQADTALKQKLQRGKAHKKQPPKEDMRPTTETLESIVEALDEIVYVSDLTTYELYYVNAAGRRMTGAHDYKGRKCYKVFQGRDDPCEFCTNHFLKEDRFYTREWDNKELKRHFLVKDKLIPWREKTARMGVAVDISEREILSQAVREKLDFAESMLTCAKALAEEPDMGRAVRRILATVVEFHQSDRAYLFEPDPHNKAVWNDTYEWCRAGIEHEKENLQHIHAAVMQRWMDLFGRHASVILSNVEELRESEPQEWEALRCRGIRRLIAVPIHKEGELVGFLGVDNPRHCITDDSLMRMLSLFVVNRLNKNETEERLGELLNLHYRDVLKDTELGLWFIRIDPCGDRRELFADETMRHVLGLEKELSPEACYQHWYHRIHQDYSPYVDKTVQDMIQQRKVVQLEYLWNHPTMGEVMVRCTGVRTTDAGGMVCLEGYHRIISNVECPQCLAEPTIQ